MIMLALELAIERARDVARMRKSASPRPASTVVVDIPHGEGNIHLAS